KSPPVCPGALTVPQSSACVWLPEPEASRSSVAFEPGCANARLPRRPTVIVRSCEPGSSEYARADPSSTLTSFTGRANSPLAVTNDCTFAKELVQGQALLPTLFVPAPIVHPSETDVLPEFASGSENAPTPDEKTPACRPAS